MNKRFFERFRKMGIVTLFFVVGVLGTVLLYTIGLRLLDRSAFGLPRITVKNPGYEFTEFTGFVWPDAATVIAADIPYSAPFGEKEFYLVFETDSEVVKDWLSKRPPWEASIWKYGPVPPEIGLHVTFGTSGVGIHSQNGGSFTYYGDERLIQLLNSSNTLYAVKERCCNGDPSFNNGNLLIIEPDLNKIWLVTWDN